MPADIFNNGSSLTKNIFNTNQSVGPIGFKDNWNIGTGSSAGAKSGMFFLSNINRLIVVCSSFPQYFNDTTGALINITGGLPSLGVFIYIPSLNIAYSRNTTQYSTSTDGITWTAPANILGAIANVASIVYSPSLSLYVGISQELASPYIQTSTNGITWTLRSATRNVHTIIYTGTKFITFGLNGCMYSYDGITWVNDTVQLGHIRAAIYCQSLGCILSQIWNGSMTDIIRSYDDGLTWTTLYNVFPPQVNISSTPVDKFEWDNVSGKAYIMQDDNSGFLNTTCVWEFDASGNPALGGNINMMGNISINAFVNSGIDFYNYNPALKRFYFVRGNNTVFYSTASLNQAVSGNQYIIGSLNCSGGYTPYGLANIDIMLRDTPFIGIQYVNGSISTSLFNSPFTAFGSTAPVISPYATTNNFTRQLCCNTWSFTAPSDGQVCGYGSTL